MNPTPVNHSWGQGKSCPLHVFLYFESQKLKKITLSNSQSFALFTPYVNWEIINWFEQFLSGCHLPFPLELSLEVGPFSRRVLKELEKVPFAATVSYRDLAEKVGCPKGARAVGNACHTNPYPLVIPCHRVIQTNGKLGGFAYGLEMKQALLDFENPSCSPIFPL